MCQVSKRNHRGETPLHCAAIKVTKQMLINPSEINEYQCNFADPNRSCIPGSGKFYSDLDGF